MNKKLAYRLIKFVVLSFIIIYLLYFRTGMPLSIVLLFEILLIIKTLPIREFIEKNIIKHFPKYKNIKKPIRYLILLACYILLYILIKWIIINLLLVKIFNIPIEEQIYEFINHSMK
jgi:hypothetical protein